MNRRNAITAISGVAAASILVGGRSAHAQTTVEGAPGGESVYQTRTLTIGTLSKQISQLALTNAVNSSVKQFADFEVAEQTTIAQALTRTNNPPPAPLPAALQAQLEQLQATSGKAFDVAYIQAQLQGHQQLLDIQQSFLNENPTDYDHMHIAMMARTVIQMHLIMLAELQRTIGAA